MKSTGHALSPSSNLFGLALTCVEKQNVAVCFLPLRTVQITAVGRDLDIVAVYWVTSKSSVNSRGFPLRFVVDEI